MLTKHGRIADLLVGFILIGVGVQYASPWIVASGALAFLTYSIDLNGIVQRFTMKRVLTRPSAQRR
ncbi:hypothetical protein [Sphingomonas sp. 3-13AW]|uniref:hypothetical protein n=1 Tax=Sphingomonas sp. 3-13AW TaxID=3050450 RepID=UPI003BB71667